MSLLNEDYTVAWISALSDELAAAQALLDEEHDDLPAVLGDYNAYTLGRIGKHNVVIAGLPRGSIGTTSAASVAANLLRSFPNVKFGLMVGIGGGVPAAVRLGDIVVSNPERQSGGVIQYDLGTSTADEFIRRGVLPGPPNIVSTAITKLSAFARRKGYKFNTYYEDMLAENPRMSDFKRPLEDALFQPDYTHVGSKGDCSKCDIERTIARTLHTESIVHYGLIGSGNSVVRNAIQRDKLYEQEGIICFEMEAAGLMKDFPCLVIRGICDYCDTHKDKVWQPYAAGIAAAYAKELLMTIPACAIASMPRNELFEAVEQQTLEIKSLHITEQDAHETAKQTQSTIQNIEAKLENSERRKLAESDLECLRSLNAADSHIDKVRIEDIKGGLLKDAYKWILQNKEYLKWRNDGKLLWIRGDPGKGKTMLLCGIINELESELNSGSYKALDGKDNRNLVYFFCQATYSANNSAAAVLRGLIYSILQQSPTLIDHVRNRFDECNDLQAANTLYVLIDVLDILFKVVDLYILIDALDECIVHRDKLLEVICRFSQSYRSYWIVTSRNWNDIGIGFKNNSDVTPQLSLELNAESVSQAVVMYINHKVKELSTTRGYDSELQDSVQDHLIRYAGGTFLWVALVCIRLAKVRLYRTRSTLTEYTAGLSEVYDRMITMIEESTDEHLLKQILRRISIVYEPIHLNELPNLIDLSDELSANIVWLEELVNDCGSFLTIRANRIEFVHQSAKDYIDKWLVTTPNTRSNLHFEIYNASVQTMYQHLRRDLYQVQDPGTHIQDIALPDPDPLACIRYPSIYWFQHLEESGEYGQHVAEEVVIFLKQCFLYWLEALALSRASHKVFSALRGLESFVKRLPSLKSFVTDAYNFALYFKEIVEEYPLQLYCTALIFSPGNSEVRIAFQDDLDPNVQVLCDTTQSNWPTRRMLNRSDSSITAVRYSHDGLKLAVADMEGKIQVSDTISGRILLPVLFHPLMETQSTSPNVNEPTEITDIAFRPDGSSLLVTVTKRMIDLRSLIKKQCFQTQWQKFYSWDFSMERWRFILEVATDTQLAISDQNAQWIAYCTSESIYQKNNCLSLFDVNTSKTTLSLPGLTGQIEKIVFSCDSGGLAVSWGGNYISAWSIPTGIAIGHTVTSGSICNLALCPKKTKIASVHKTQQSPNQEVWPPFKGGYRLKIYEIASGCILWSQDLDSSVIALDFSFDGRTLILLQDSREFKLYNSLTGDLQRDFSEHGHDEIQNGAFQYDLRCIHIAMVSHSDCRSFIIDVDDSVEATDDLHNTSSSLSVIEVYCSPHATDILLRYVHKLDVWNIETGRTILTVPFDSWQEFYSIFGYLHGYFLVVHNNKLREPNAKTTISRLENHQIRLEMEKAGVQCWTVPQCGSLIAFSNESNDIFLQNFKTRKTVELIHDGIHTTYKRSSLTFSAHGSRIAGLASDPRYDNPNNAIIIWDTETGKYFTKIVLGFSIFHGILSLSPSGHSLYAWNEVESDSRLQHRIYNLQNAGDTTVIFDQAEKFKIGWCRSVVEDFSIIKSIESSLAPLELKYKREDLGSYTAMVKILPQLGNDMSLSIPTSAGIITRAKGDIKYGSSTDVYMCDEWVYRDGQPFLWIPPSFRLGNHGRPNRSAYASQCLTIMLGTGGFIMLRFGFGSGLADSHENQKDSKGYLRSKMPDGKTYTVDYLIQFERHSFNDLEDQQDDDTSDTSERFLDILEDDDTSGSISPTS